MSEDPSKPAIVFFGTPNFAVTVLSQLEERGITPDLIVTAPSKPVGRKHIVTPPPVHAWASERGIPVIQPASLRKPSDELDQLRAGTWDLFLVAAYGLLIPQDILDLPQKGTLNVHPSLLPKYRGPAPVQGQLLADDHLCGVTIIELDEQMDHGPIVAQEKTEPPAWPIRASLLNDALWSHGGALLADIIPEYLAGECTLEHQDHDAATYTQKVEKKDGRIKLKSEDPRAMYLKYCAYDPWPGVYFLATRDDKRIRVKVVEAKFRDETFEILRVIPEGKKEMSYEQFLKSE